MAYREEVFGLPVILLKHVEGGATLLKLLKYSSIPLNELISCFLVFYSRILYPNNLKNGNKFSTDKQF